MNAGIIKMIVPSILKLADSPEVKAKLIELLEAKKRAYFADNATEDNNYLDIRLMLSSTPTEITVRVVMNDFEKSCVVSTLDYYKYEYIVAAVKNLL